MGSIYKGASVARRGHSVATPVRIRRKRGEGKAYVYVYVRVWVCAVCVPCVPYTDK